MDNATVVRLGFMAVVIIINLMLAAAALALVAFVLIAREALAPHPTATPALPNFVCPFCGSRGSVRAETRLATGGWVMFAVLPLVLAPLGGMIRQRWLRCRQCEMTVGQG